MGDAGLAKCSTPSTGPGHPDVLAHVVLDEREARAGRRGARCWRWSPVTQVVDADHLVAPVEQALAEVRAEEPGAAGDDDPAHAAQARPMPSYSKPAPRERVAVEEVAGVDDPPAGHGLGHLVEVEPPELVPLGEHHQHLGAVAGGVRVGDDLDALELRVGVARLDRRVVGLDRRRRASRRRRMISSDGRLAQVVGAGLEREAPARRRVTPSSVAAGHGARPSRPPGRTAPR